MLYRVKRPKTLLSAALSDTKLSVACRHRVYGRNLPVILTNVTRFKGKTHKQTFTYLTPAVWESLPEDICVSPELVVLSNKCVMTLDFYQDVIDLVKRHMDFSSTAHQLEDRYKRTFSIWNQRFKQYRLGLSQAQEQEVSHT